MERTERQWLIWKDEDPAEYENYPPSRAATEAVSRGSGAAVVESEVTLMTPQAASCEGAATKN